MNPGVLALLIPIFAVLGAFTMIIFLRRYQNIERMSMLERGINPSDFKTAKAWPKRDPYRHIRIACTAIGIGIGLFTGTILKNMFSFQQGGIILAAMIFMFGGACLLISFIVQMRLQDKARKEGRIPSDDDGYV